MKAWVMIGVRPSGERYSTVCVDNEIPLVSGKEFIETEAAQARQRRHKVRTFELEIPEPTAITITEIV